MRNPYAIYCIVCQLSNVVAGRKSFVRAVNGLTTDRFRDDM